MIAQVDTSMIYQFKITLRGSKPPIWRRIQVADSLTFFDLHIAIQDAMHGWMGYHLHKFEFHNGPLLELPNPEDGHDFAAIFGIVRPKPLREDTETLKKHFNLTERKKCIYEYDFGDGWEHEILLEKIIPRDLNKSYPILVSGKRACPAEDSGSIYGYMEKLETLSDPNNAEYQEISNWMLEQTVIQRGEDETFDPAKFVVGDVEFRDPKSVSPFM